MRSLPSHLALSWYPVCPRSGATASPVARRPLRRPHPAVTGSLVIVFRLGHAGYRKGFTCIKNGKDEATTEASDSGSVRAQLAACIPAGTHLPGTVGTGSTAVAALRPVALAGRAPPP